MMYQTITIRRLEEYLDRDENMVLVDLRNRSSFLRCHIKGAINVPYDELETSLDLLPKDRLLVFYCARGGQSMLACNHLSDKGYRVLNVASGLSCYNGKYLVRT